MSIIVRAKSLTFSSSDSLGRVKVSAPGVWENSPLISTLNASPINKDDIVYVLMSEDFDNPLIIGKSFFSSTRCSLGTFKGSVLFDSSNGSTWTVSIVYNSRFLIENSNGSLIEINGNTITIESGSITVNGDNLTVKGDNITVSGDSINVSGSIVANRGLLGGLVNSEAIVSLAKAILSDLVEGLPGTNLTLWMGTTMVTGLEDNNFKH